MIGLWVEVVGLWCGVFFVVGIFSELGCLVMFEVVCFLFEVVMVFVGVVYWFGVVVKVCEVCGMLCVVVCEGEVICMIFNEMGV